MTRKVENNKVVKWRFRCPVCLRFNDRFVAAEGGQTSASFGVVYQLELRKYWRQVCDFSGRRREILWLWIVHGNLFEIVDTEILRESSFGV